MGAGVVALITAPFVAFLLVLISGAIAYVVWAEKRDRQAREQEQ